MATSPAPQTYENVRLSQRVPGGYPARVDRRTILVVHATDISWRRVSRMRVTATGPGTRTIVPATQRHMIF